MDRRSFLAGAALAPALTLPALPAVALPTNGLRIIGRGWEEMMHDPGHKLWSQHMGLFMGQWRVLLDGVDQFWFSAADEVEGWVRRTMTVGDNPTFGATLCLDGKGEWFEEIVYGKVEIVPLVCEKAISSYPFEDVRKGNPYLYSRLKIEGVNCPVGFY